MVINTIEIKYLELISIILKLNNQLTIMTCVDLKI